jgi:hypothetical protein
MPVTIEVAITDSQPEKKARLEPAELFGATSEPPAPARASAPRRC